MSIPSRSRAADVLRRLESDRDGATEGSDAADEPVEPSAVSVGQGDGLGSRMGRYRGWSGRVPSTLTALAGVAAVVIVVASLTVARRPPPIEDRLPLATEQAPATVTTGPVPEGPDPSPSTSASDAASAGVVVHVVGAVARPGVVRLPGEARAVDAVEAAGGLLPSADPARVNLAAVLIDGQRVVVPAVGEDLPAEVPGPGPTASGGSAPTATAPTDGGALIDLNSATAEQLDVLPGIGPATAAAIVAHREEHGPFTAVDSLIDVRGIGEAKLEGLSDLVSIGRASP